MHFFLDLFMFHHHYSNCRPQNSGWYNRIICQTVENTSFLERLSCILHAFAKGSYQGYKSNFGFRFPFSCEILPMGDSRKYPYYTTDGFQDFRRGGGVHDYGILRAWGGYLRFEIQRHGGIPQVGFLEQKVQSESFKTLLLWNFVVRK